jgi:hypothetical protein
MPMDLQDRTQYLSLALFSQKVISALMDYVDKNKVGGLKPSLDEALISLSSVQTKHPSSLPQRANRPIRLGSLEATPLAGRSRSTSRLVVTSGPEIHQPCNTPNARFCETQFARYLRRRRERSGD